MVYYQKHVVLKYSTNQSVHVSKLVRKDTWLAGTIETHPAENSNWRRHKNACPFYRERWFPCNDVAGEPMYQVFCLKGTPPETLEEQEKCFRSKSCCWREASMKRQAKRTAEAEQEASAARAATR
jgi:hypothetical protein